MRLFDGHTHSGNSYDAEHDVIFMAEKAEAMGLWGFAVTDHCEIERYREDRLDRVIYQPYLTLNSGSIFEGRIKIIRRGRMGQPVVSFSDCGKDFANRGD